MFLEIHHEGLSFRTKYISKSSLALANEFLPSQYILIIDKELEELLLFKPVVAFDWSGEVRIETVSNLSCLAQKLPVGFIPQLSLHLYINVRGGRYVQILQLPAG
mmetsp:Transcript_23587/g.23256  ORF Transcript_23587/g.23256 Transcript_23587/m.23256 type:complete len:105 (+) Transcript_23587:287-601(+)